MELEESYRSVSPQVPLPLKALLSPLKRLACGELTVILPDGRRFAIRGIMPGTKVKLHLHRPLRLLARLIHRGDIGFAEGFMAGDFSTPDLSGLLKLAARNEVKLSPKVVHGSSLARSMINLRHRLRQNSKRGSRKNIAYHYDLGNDFYQLWLDETMAYSCALFDTPEQTLRDAQINKYNRLLDLLNPKPDERLLEMGCGWGGFTLAAARRGLRVTGITLSNEQLAYAQAKVNQAGLQDRIELRLQDYRDVRDRFDHIVSIEMFEAVGEQYWTTFFDTLRRCLKPAGRAAMQVITIADDYFSAYRQRVDFIQHYIFPGGMLPTVTLFNQHATAAGLVIKSRALFGKHYARTLQHWAARVRACKQEIHALGFDERFLHMWFYYLAYCEAGFTTGRLDLMQVALERT